MTIKRKPFILGLLALGLSLGLGKFVFAQGNTLTIYSGRSEKLIGPLIEQAEDDLGIDIKVRYGKSAQLAIAIEEEGNNILN